MVWMTSVAVTIVSSQLAQCPTAVRCDGSLTIEYQFERGRYGILIRGKHPQFSIRDLFGNDLAGGNDFRSGFIIDNKPRLGSVSLQLRPQRRASPIVLSGSFADGPVGGPYTTTIDWGDGSRSTLTPQSTPGSFRAIISMQTTALIRPR